MYFSVFKRAFITFKTYPFGLDTRIFELSAPQKHAHAQAFAPLSVAEFYHMCQITSYDDANPGLHCLNETLQQAQPKHLETPITQSILFRAC